MWFTAIEKVRKKSAQILKVKEIPSVVHQTCSTFNCESFSLLPSHTHRQKIHLTYFIVVFKDLYTMIKNVSSHWCTPNKNETLIFNKCNNLWRFSCEIGNKWPQNMYDGNWISDFWFLGVGWKEGIVLAPQFRLDKSQETALRINMNSENVFIKEASLWVLRLQWNGNFGVGVGWMWWWDQFWLNI